MLQPTLLMAALFALASAGIYFYVGYCLTQRQLASADARLAWTMFVVWWYGLAGTTTVSAVMNLLGALGVIDLALFITFTQVNLLVICVALFGLLYYLLYLFTGKRSLLIPLILFYIGYYILLMYFINSRQPIGVTTGRWTMTVDYQQSTTGPLFVVVALLLLFPQIIGSLAYFTLFFRVEDTTQKYRIALVSWSIIIWFGASYLASFVGLSQQDWWQIVSRLLGLVAALVILIAYQPLRWIKQRFGVLSISDQAAA